MVLLKINSRNEGEFYYDISTIINCETDGTTLQIMFVPGYNTQDGINMINLDNDKNAVTEEIIIALNEAIINASSRPGSTVDYNKVTGLEVEQQRIQIGSNIPQIS
ncbi:MAG: hypothetical protein ACR2M9_00030 [Cyanophyceae cyanobacterium]